jgi:hypothetical protein
MRVCVVGGGLAAFVAASVATAATGWKPFATASDSSEYGAYVSASATVLKPKTLGVRVSQAAELSVNVSCDFEVKRAPAGKVLVLNVGAAKSCRVYGSANTNSAGTLRVELLRGG